MTLHFRALAAQVAEDSAISAQEILELRRAAWPDAKIDSDEAEAIFILNDQIKAPTPEWSDFFVEALVEFVVNGTEPRGHVSDDTAHWLIERISHDGKVNSLTEMELMVRVLEKAISAPGALRLFVLEQLEHEVLTGKGPTRDGGAFDPGCITAAECTMIRRVIFSSGGNRPAGVSSHEAEMLFRLKDATLGAPNAPEWERLFVQGIGNYLQGWNGARGISRSRASELEAFMDDRSTHIGRFFWRMAKVNASGFAQGLREVGFGRKKPVRDIASEVASDHAVTEAENLWLQARIDADGLIDPLESALLQFLADG